ncbi:hypothetical protein IFM89_015736 [Coptis chinensis]|uniref:NAD(P)-binding domain-containing protein n=1 Tax=Coptis chinensis TaxID=261450 RepID=A0A835HYR5_9MAGN|nr:hypothetical protein IFM89_015736 [Coptis chinensis]
MKQQSHSLLAMELLLQPCPLTILPSSSSSLSRKVLKAKHTFLTAHKLTFISNNKSYYPSARKLEVSHFRAQASESARASAKSISVTTDAINQDIGSKDENLVFVAGATGKVGSRTVRELLKLGFRVRAGVRSAQRAETLVQSVKQLNISDGASAVEKLEIVECDLEQDRIEPAIANASVVVCCIGASEKEVFDVTGPYRIDYQATKNLIDAATVAGVDHFILLTSLGTNKIGFPAAILNLFWGVLIWKRKAEEALIASGLPYTIVRPGGMERPTDAYKETHNVSLSKEDTLFGGQVSNLQVAELMAFMTKNRDLSYCKVVEVIAETTAPLSPFGELLSKIPSQWVDRSSVKSIVPTTTSSVVKKGATQTKKRIMTPSPYILYVDLKPPTTPTSIPSISQTTIKDTSDKVAESKPIPSYTQDSSIKEEEVKPVSSFAEDSSIKEIKKLKPLSPYSVYDDLKPPTSPSPTAPTPGTNGHVIVVQAVSEPAIAASQIDVSALTTEARSSTVKLHDTRPLSPYFVYEDLKPPTSPTPTFSAPRRGFVVAAQPTNEAVPSSEYSNITGETPTKVLAEVPTPKTSYLSPYPVYDDLKPPTSPSPYAPKVSPLSTSTTEAGSLSSPKQDTGIAEPPTSDKLVETKHITESKPRPLSPFTM